MNQKEIAALLRRLANRTGCLVPSATKAFNDEAELLDPQKPREWDAWVDPKGHLSSLGNHCGEGVAQRVLVRQVLP